jgi:phosphoenolpyruvate synthase/pyruvate phosphate dikinase
VIPFTDDAILSAPVGAKARMLGVLSRLSQEHDWTVPEGAAFTVEECTALLREPARTETMLCELAAAGLDICVAVRSSARVEDLDGRSAAGQYRTVLGVSGPAELAAALRTVVRSYSTEAAFAYGRATTGQVGLTHGDGGVIVQRMVPATRSGAMFVRRAEVIVEAVRGLGAGLMVGEVTPTHYAVDTASEDVVCWPAPQRTMTTLVGSRVVEAAVPPDLLDTPVLEPDDLLDLYEAGLELREHLGGDQEVEWAFDGAGRLALLQARPLATRSGR